MSLKNLHGRGFTIQEFESRFVKLQHSMKENNIDAIENQFREEMENDTLKESGIQAPAPV